MKVFELFGQVDLKDGDVQSKLDGISSKAEGLGGKLKKSITTVGKWGAAIGAGAAAGATALFGVASKSAEATDEIDKMSQKIGISKQAYQEYSYILSQNGTDVQVLQRGMRTLTQRMEESASGSGKGAEAFNTLGISATDLNGELKTQEQMFDEAAKALMQLPEGTEKSTLAFELFGRTGQELMPMLNGTAEGMEELRNEAHNMGLVLSDEAVQAGADFTDMKDNVTRALGAVVANIGVELMPMFMTMFQWIMDHMPQIQEMISTVFGVIEKVVTVVIDVFTQYLQPALTQLFEWVQENMPAIQATFEVVWQAISTAVEVAIDVITGIIDVFIGLFTGDWNQMAEGVKKVWSGMWTAIKTVVSGAWGLLKSAFSGLHNSIKGWFVDLASDAISWGSDIVKGIWQGITDVTEWLTDKIRGFAEGIANTFKNFFGIKSPSTLMAGYGANISEGLAQGINAKSDEPVNAMVAIGRRINEAAEEAVNKANATLAKVGSSSSSRSSGGGGGGGSSSRSMSTEQRFKRLSDNQEYYSKNKDAIDRISKDHNADLGESVKRHQKNDYHDGGWVGNPLKLKRDEEEAILQKGEFVLSKEMIRNAGKDKGREGIVQHITINSPDPLSPSEIARQVKNASRELAMGV